jgi:hypothetical protein
MSITTYGELKTFLTTFGHRSDLTARIPDFVTQAESMIAQEVRAIELVTVATLDETDRVDAGVYSLPTDWLGARQVFSTQGELRPVGLAELRRYVASAPVFQFATYGTQIEFRGVPATDAEIELLYYARPAAFSADGDSNALLLAYPGLYTHASMHWLHLFTQDMELADQHLKLFMSMVERVNELANRQRGSGSVAAPHNLTSRSTM